MTTSQQPLNLEQRILVDKIGNEIKFSDLHPQLQKIAKSLYESSKQGTQYSSFRLKGLPNDEEIFSGNIFHALHTIRDFMTGEYDDKGKIRLGSGKGNIGLGFGTDWKTYEDTTSVCYDPRNY